MEAKRTDFDHIRQHANKVKKYASDRNGDDHLLCT
jgi:exo-beta-1,3-glucanase (GH17 family)